MVEGRDSTLLPDYVAGSAGFENKPRRSRRFRNANAAVTGVFTRSRSNAGRKKKPVIQSVSRADSIDWSTLAYELGLQGLAQEIAVNSVVDLFSSDQLRLKLPPELKRLSNQAIEQEILQAIRSKFGVSYRLDLVEQAQLEAETPHQSRARQQEDHRRYAIGEIRQCDVVKKLHQAFGAELVESSVRRIED
ncbi:MAG: hypothetical protein GY820_06960 [Gammaproteobacteria bacterium]|nr:hypothetical protein [Gammaproteobacteria bacterium]